MTATTANASAAAAVAAANQPTTVGAYLRELPPDRRVAMARVCSMIRRSARGVRESMRYGLAFYELDGPLFALESGKRHMSLFVAEQDVVIKHKDAVAGVDIKRSFVRFADLNRLPLDVVEKIVRDSVAARRVRATAGTIPTQAELLKLWSIKEEAATPPPPRQTISLKPSVPPPPAPEVVGKSKATKAPAPAIKPAPAPAAKPVAKRAAVPAKAAAPAAKAATKKAPAAAAKPSRPAAKSAAKSSAKPVAKAAAIPSSKAVGRPAAKPVKSAKPATASSARR
jgi:uncharacterized protein YdhG (YjbR/CyaY superfamily)